jgi:predicted KAP-like P-loop ATPase
MDYDTHSKLQESKKRLHDNKQDGTDTEDEPVLSKEKKRKVSFFDELDDIKNVEFLEEVSQMPLFDILPGAILPEDEDEVTEIGSKFYFM